MVAMSAPTDYVPDKKVYSCKTFSFHCCRCKSVLVSGLDASSPRLVDILIQRIAINNVLLTASQLDARLKDSVDRLSSLVISFGIFRMAGTPGKCKYWEGLSDKDDKQSTL